MRNLISFFLIVLMTISFISCDVLDSLSDQNCTFHGEVVDLSTGEPIEGASVDLVPCRTGFIGNCSSPMPISYTTGANGTWEANAIEESSRRYIDNVSAEGYHKFHGEGNFQCYEEQPILFRKTYMYKVKNIKFLDAQFEAGGAKRDIGIIIGHDMLYTWSYYRDLHHPLTVREGIDVPVDTPIKLLYKIDGVESEVQISSDLIASVNEIVVE